MDRNAQFRNKAVSKESMVTIRKNTIVLIMGTRKRSDQSRTNLYCIPEGSPFPIGILRLTFSEIFLFSFIKNLAVTAD
jgi:hypothetical protein